MAAAKSTGQLVGQNICLADLGRCSQQFFRVLHERGGNLSGEVSFPAAVIIERIEDRERAVIEAHGEPAYRARFGVDQVLRARQESGNRVFLPGLASSST